MKFYIASRLDNAANARKVADYLRYRGWEQTYDWTVHGLVTDRNQLEEISLREIHGVIDADVLFVLLPGARGTHTELGAAIATCRPIVILAHNQEAFERDGHLCVFYRHPMVYDRLIHNDITRLAFQAHRIGKKALRWAARCNPEPDYDNIAREMNAPAVVMEEPGIQREG